MDNLFQFVQALTVAHDFTEGLPAPVCGRTAAIENGIKKGNETRKKLRELKIKSGEIICLGYAGGAE
jgi:hypothetical protein